jgi:hypothetical protein
MTKDHYLPRLIIRNFTDPSGKIYFYNKKTKKVYGPYNHYNQLQEKNFYSKKPIIELKNIFSHIEINPIFQREDLNLDKNIELFVESPTGAILSKIIKEILNKYAPIVSNEESELIKKYFVVQHLRTPAFKRVSDEVRKQPLIFPSNIKKLIIDIEHNRSVDFKELVKKKFPNLNSKQRRAKVRELEKSLKKRLKQDPNFIKNIRNSQEIEDFLDEEIKKVEEEIEKIRTHPDKHSSEILDRKMNDKFFKKYNFDKRKIKFIINKTNIPFVLSDNGIVTICWDYGSKQELHFYLPIHSRILIEFSEDLEANENVNEEFVKEFNQISLNESLINIYSYSKEVLELLSRDYLSRKIPLY